MNCMASSQACPGMHLFPAPVPYRSKAQFIRGQERILCNAPRPSAGNLVISLRLPRISPSQIAVSTQEAQGEVTQLKDKLILQLEATDGYISDEAIQTVTELQKFNPNPDYTAVPELYNGAFEAVKVSFKGTGKKGEGSKKVESRGTALTLGRLTFNSFKPVDLEIFMGQIYNHVGLQGKDYLLITEFQLSRVGELELEAPLEGLSILKGEYTITSPVRMDLAFSTISLAPRYPDKDLELWKRVFEVDNSGMDEKGVVPAQLPAIPGFVEFLYLDDQLRITRGNQGNINVVRRLQEPVISAI